MSLPKTINELLKEFFESNPNLDWEHGPVVGHGHPPRDVWRAIRRLHQEGFLIKVRKGVYRYDPAYAHRKELLDFSTKVRAEILRRDGYKCVLCGRGRRDGVELVVDHITPKDKGGSGSVDNGQTLCMECNLMKKNYNHTQAGKRFFIRMYEKAQRSGDKKTLNFLKAVFDVYDRFGVDKDIPRPDD